MANYTDQEIAGFIEMRSQKIFEIERLWTRLCGLRNERVNFRTLDAEINEFFDVGDGRNSLAFESIEKIKSKLAGEIAAFENGKTSQNVIKDSPLYALSIRQPWAWLILNLAKDIENRDWLTSFRGNCAIHASKSMTRREYEDARDFVLCSIGFMEANQMPPFECYPLGGIVGTVEITDCVKESNSPWFQGNFGFVLADPKPLIKPITINGALKFWEVPQDVKQQINKQEKK